MNCDFLIVSINSEGKEDLPFSFEMLSAGLFLLLPRMNIKNIFFSLSLSIEQKLSHAWNKFFSLWLAKNNFSVKYLKRDFQLSSSKKYSRFFLSKGENHGKTRNVFGFAVIWQSSFLILSPIDEVTLQLTWGALALSGMPSLFNIIIIIINWHNHNHNNQAGVKLLTFCL